MNWGASHRRPGTPQSHEVKKKRKISMSYHQSSNFSHLKHHKYQVQRQLGRRERRHLCFPFSCVPNNQREMQRSLLHSSSSERKGNKAKGPLYTHFNVLMSTTFGLSTII
jgi:hypothetical protein